MLKMDTFRVVETEFSEVLSGLSRSTCIRHPHTVVDECLVGAIEFYGRDTEDNAYHVTCVASTVYFKVDYSDSSLVSPTLDSTTVGNLIIKSRDLLEALERLIKAGTNTKKVEHYQRRMDRICEDMGEYILWAL